MVIFFESYKNIALEKNHKSWFSSVRDHLDMEEPEKSFHNPRGFPSGKSGKADHWQTTPLAMDPPRVDTWVGWTTFFGRAFVTSREPLTTTQP